MLCKWEHHIVIKDIGDSLRISHLDEECNAGFWSETENNLTVPKRKGTYGNLIINEIEDSKIKATIDRGHELVNISLLRQDDTEEAFRTLNIIQMQKIDAKLEEYIQASSPHAEKNNLYLTENYVPDPKCESLNPYDFYQYYLDKKQKVAKEVIDDLQDPNKL